MSSTVLTIPNEWRPRPHQIQLYDQFGHGRSFQRGCAIWHRRAGKDSVALNLTARDMILKKGTYWHLFPEQAQARRAIWNGTDSNGVRFIDQAFPVPLRKRVNSQDMLIELHNGSIWQMGGSDNFDSLMGANPVGVVFSEWSLAHPEAWDYIRPILIENGGWALFIYTPRGHNHGYTTWMNALDADEWFSQCLTIGDTGLITPTQIETERASGMSEGKIRQEFYCSFEAANDQQLIATELVFSAIRNDLKPDVYDEKIIGVDVARFGDDHSVIYFRHGRDGCPLPYERFAGLDTMQLAARVASWIQTWHPDAVFIDEGGVGGGVVDRLRQLGFGQVQGVNFGRKSDCHRTGELAGNKRSEMWLALRSWLDGASVPDDTRLVAELTGPNYSYNAHNEIMLEKKEDMKKRGIPSPDVADALALTLAYPVASHAWENTNFESDENHASSGRSPTTGY